MRTTKSSWAKDWTDYNLRGPATTYYRLADVTRALRYYGHEITASPNMAINPYSDAAYLVAQIVEPYRVVYHR